MSGELGRKLIADGSIRAMGLALASGQVKAVDLVRASFERVERLDGGLNAFIRTDRDAAEAEARESDKRRERGERIGPLDGVPYAVKDLIDVQGWPTTAGSQVFSQEAKKKDAGSVARLRRAGAVMIGKTGLHELAYGVTSENPHFGAVRNPWDATRSPGGSSGGSAAAVAAAMAPFALGTDTGCSVRHPAHCCGVVGIKPTHGRVSAAGVVPLVRQMDHVGPLARSVLDAALALDAMAGFDPDDGFSRQAQRPLQASLAVQQAREDGGFDGVRVGRLRGEGFDSGDGETLELVQNAIDIVASRLRLTLVDVEPPGLHDLWRAAARLFAGDPSANYAEAMRRSPDLFGEDVRAKLAHGLRVGAGAFAAAQEEARRFRMRLSLQEQELGLAAMMAPTCGAPAPRITMQADGTGGGRDPWADYATINCTPFNITGQPAVSIPCGKTGAGLPVGLMIIAPRGRDEDLLALAALAERALAGAGVWNNERPPL